MLDFGIDIVLVPTDKQRRVSSDRGVSARTTGASAEVAKLYIARNQTSNVPIFRERKLVIVVFFLLIVSYLFFIISIFYRYYFPFFRLARLSAKNSRLSAASRPRGVWNTPRIWNWFLFKICGDICFILYLC